MFKFKEVDYSVEDIERITGVSFEELKEEGFKSIESFLRSSRVWSYRETITADELAKILVENEDELNQIEELTKEEEKEEQEQEKEEDEETVTLYHVTKEENVEGILDNKLKWNGDNTAQLGKGLYFTDWDNLYFWADHLNSWEVVEFEVELNKDQLLLPSDYNEPDIINFAKKEGLLNENSAPTDKLINCEEFSSEDNFDIEAEGVIINRYARSEGYKGILGSNQLVLFDYSLIKSVDYGFKIDSNFKFQNNKFKFEEVINYEG